MKSTLEKSKDHREDQRRHGCRQDLSKIGIKLDLLYATKTLNKLVEQTGVILPNASCNNNCVRRNSSRGSKLLTLSSTEEL